MRGGKPGRIGNGRKLIPQPDGVDGQLAVGESACVDGMLVQPHLDFRLPLQPLFLGRSLRLRNVGVVAGNV